VAATARSESDPRRLSPAEVRTLARTLGAQVATSWKEFRNLEQNRRRGQELWPFVLWLVVGLLFLELGLEQFFARRR
jgi:hypothetical protein